MDQLFCVDFRDVFICPHSHQVIVSICSQFTRLFGCQFQVWRLGVVFCWCIGCCDTVVESAAWFEPIRFAEMTWKCKWWDYHKQMSDRCILLALHNKDPSQLVFALSRTIYILLQITSTHSGALFYRFHVLGCQLACVASGIEWEWIQVATRKSRETCKWQRLSFQEVSLILRPNEQGVLRQFPKIK